MVGRRWRRRERLPRNRVDHRHIRQVETPRLDASMLGITFKGASGLGDKLQFSSLPENYFRNTGEKVIDVDRSRIFDHNPYVERDKVPDRVIDLWSQPWPLQKGVTQKE
jgi:hypothetical protein